jgi:hypothetical protein
VSGKKAGQILFGMRLINNCANHIGQRLRN